MAVKSFKILWNAHKWTGIILAVIFLMTATTGFMLLIKKRNNWIQPPTQEGRPGAVVEFISIERAMRSVFTQDHGDFRSMDDIDRIDIRPGKRVFKVRSNHNYSEIQVCAITGDVLSVGWRPSDLFESIHDGSFFGRFVHNWVMPVVTIALVFLVFSGVWLWVEPIVRRRRRKRRTRLKQTEWMRASP